VMRFVPTLVIEPEPVNAVIEQVEVVLKAT
jgi:hypothetical protein